MPPTPRLRHPHLSLWCARLVRRRVSVQPRAGPSAPPACTSACPCIRKWYAAAWAGCRGDTAMVRAKWDGVQVGWGETRRVCELAGAQCKRGGTAGEREGSGGAALTSIVHVIFINQYYIFIFIEKKELAIN